MSTAYLIPDAPVKPKIPDAPVKPKSKTGVCDGGMDILETIPDGLELWGYFKPHDLRTPAYYLTADASGPLGCTCPDFLIRTDANPLHVCKHMRDLRCYLLPDAGENPSLAALFPAVRDALSGQKAMDL